MTPTITTPAMMTGVGMFGVPVTLGATVQIGTPQTLFELTQRATFSDMTDDAQRFLVDVPVGGATRANALTVVLNWQAGLTK